MAEKTEKPLPTWKFILQCVVVPIVVSMVASGGTVTAAWFMTVRKQVSESVGEELRAREIVRVLVPVAVAAVNSRTRHSQDQSDLDGALLDDELRTRWDQQQLHSQDQQPYPDQAVRDEVKRFKQVQEQQER